MNTSATASGAAARALAALVEPLLGGAGRVEVGQARHRRGSVAFYVEPVGAGVESPAALSDKLRELPGVAQVATGHRACYVVLDAAALATAVVDGILGDPGYGDAPATGERVVVTFSDPNLNKPLHLGHLRNNLVGMAVAGLLRSQGHDASPHVMHSDWGIHICQALLGYLRGDEAATPESTGLKSDHFVGAQYVRYYEDCVTERAAAAEGAPSEREREAYDLLTRIENGDVELGLLARRLTDWAEEGVRATYARIGTRPDVILSERDCLPLARAAITEHCRAGRCMVRDDGSVYAPLRGKGLDDLTLFRQDGTALVYTQWLGVDLCRAAEHSFDRVVQVSGREWELGEVLYTALREHLGYEWIKTWRIIHYGMVRRAGSKMKSRTGEAVRIDDLLDRTVAALRADEGHSPAAAERLALGGVKLFFLGVPRKNDIDFDEAALAADGLDAFAAIVDLVRRGVTASAAAAPEHATRLVPLLLKLDDYPRVLLRATERLEPSRVVSYVREVLSLARRHAPSLDLSPGVARATAQVVTHALGVVGIELPPDLEERAAAPALVSGSA